MADNKTLKKIVGLSTERALEIMEGYRRILSGFGETLEGISILRKIEIEEGIPLFSEGDLTDTLATLVESEEFKEVIKETKAEVVTAFLNFLISSFKVVRELETFDPKQHQPEEIQKIAKTLKDLANNIEKIKKYMREGVGE